MRLLGLSLFAECLPLALAGATALGADGDFRPACEPNPRDSCAVQVRCVGRNFDSVLGADPVKKCDLNLKADVDKSFAIGIQSDKNCTEDDASVCRGTYARLERAVKKAQDAFLAGCEKAKRAGKDCTSGSSPETQRAYYLCIAQANEDAAAAERLANAALDEARKEAQRYIELTNKVAEKYLDDKKKIEAARGNAAEEPNLTKLFALRGDSFVAEQSLLDEIKARNGGQPNLASYLFKADSLARQQRAAGLAAQRTFKASDFFIERGQSTITSLEADARQARLRAEQALTAGVKPPDAGSSLSGSLATANNAMGLAAATSRFAQSAGQGGSGSSLSSLDGIAGYPAPAGSASRTPHETPIASLGGGGSVMPPKPGTLVPPVARQTASVGGEVAPGSVVAGLSGSVHGDQASSSALSASKDSVSPSSSGSVEGGDGPKLRDRPLSSGEKKQGKTDECANADCSALNDSKTTLFNAGGSIGMPKIGAADPAFATKGALDGLFGPTAAVDPLGQPTDPKKSGSTDLFSGVLDSLGGGDSSATESKASADASVAPANTKSLFLRVHSVHENALKRGSLSLFHRRL